jgi:PAS domain S-box-containing protein
MRGLTDREPHYRLLVNAVTDYAIYLVDSRGRIQSWNRGAERIKGYQSEEILGRHFSVFYTPEDTERGRPQLGLAVAASEGRFEEEAWRVRKDGSTFWADVIISAVRDEAGDLRGFAKITRDVSARRQNEEVSRRLELTEERMWIADQMRQGAMRELFRVGLDLQSVASRLADDRLRDRVEGLVTDLDNVIVHLRNQVLRGRPAGPGD